MAFNVLYTANITVQLEQYEKEILLFADHIEHR